MPRKYLSILFLVLVIVISLAFSQISFFNLPLQEGLVSSTEKKKIQKILSDYTEKIETICKNTLGASSSGKASINSAKLDEATVNAISTIINNAQYTATAKIDKIIGLGLTDAELTKLINANIGARYAETISMLQNIKALKISDDDTFVALVDQHLKTPVPTGPSNTYDQLSNYLNPSLE